MAWYRRNHKSRNLKREILNESIDFKNIITSAFYAKALYDELKVKYHPDRFLDKMMKVKADKLFQQITESKENHNALMQLKARAEKELTFNNE